MWELFAQGRIFEKRDNAHRTPWLHKVISNLDIYDIQFVNRQYHSAAFLHIIAAKNPPQGKKFEFLFTTNP